jgi:NADPH:quinone reductase-like Zn-dependent oxidoreductase
VLLSRYGGVDVLRIHDVPRPDAGPGAVLVRAAVAPVDSGEAGIRGRRGPPARALFRGAGQRLRRMSRRTGRGSGRLRRRRRGHRLPTRAAQADYAAAPAATLTPKPAAISLEEAAIISAIGVTAWAGVHAVDPRPGETAVVSRGWGSGVPRGPARPPPRRHRDRHGWS